MILSASYALSRLLRDSWGVFLGRHHTARPTIIVCYIHRSQTTFYESCTLYAQRDKIHDWVRSANKSYNNKKSSEFKGTRSSFAKRLLLLN